MNTVDINTADMNTADMNTADMNTANINTVDINTVDMNTADMNTVDMNTADMNTADMNTVDMNTADMNTADMNTVHMNTIDMNTADTNIVDMNTADMNTQDCGHWRQCNNFASTRHSLCTATQLAKLYWTPDCRTTIYYTVALELILKITITKSKFKSSVFQPETLLEHWIWCPQKHTYGLCYTIETLSMWLKLHDSNNTAILTHLLSSLKYMKEVTWWHPYLYNQDFSHQRLESKLWDIPSLGVVFLNATFGLPFLWSVPDGDLKHVPRAQPGKSCHACP